MRKFLKWFKDLFGHYKSKETLQSEAEHREIREAAHRCIGIVRPTVLTARDVSLTITDANGNVHKVDGFASDEVRVAMKTSASGRGEVFSADMKGRLTVRRKAADKEAMAKAAPVLASKLNQSRAAARVATSRRQYDDPSTDILTAVAVHNYVTSSPVSSSSSSSSCSSSNQGSSYDNSSYDSGSPSCD